MKSFAPIILFAYNRLSHIKQTVRALQQNQYADKSDLFVFSDGPKNDDEVKIVQQVRSYIKNITGFKSIKVFEREKNIGLAASVISGVTTVMELHDKVIVVEDDIVTSPDFLTFVNSALNTYKHNATIFSVSGYSYIFKLPPNYKLEVFITPRASSWGWGTWKDRWEKVDWKISDYEKFKNNKELQREFNLGGEDLSSMLIQQQIGEIDSWAVRWSYAHFKNGAYCLCPTKSKVCNIGVDGSGTHMKKSKKYDIRLEDSAKIEKLPPILNTDAELLQNFKDAFKQSIIRKIINHFNKK